MQFYGRFPLASADSYGGTSGWLWYPDVASHPSIEDFLNASLAATDSSLKFQGGRVEQGRRFMQVNRDLKERMFVLDFWDRGVFLGQLSLNEAGPLVMAAKAWCAKQRPLSYLANAQSTPWLRSRAGESIRRRS